jgi:hypothetical protein
MLPNKGRDNNDCHARTCTASRAMRNLGYDREPQVDPCDLVRSVGNERQENPGISTVDTLPRSRAGRLVGFSITLPSTRHSFRAMQAVILVTAAYRGIIHSPMRRRTNHTSSSTVAPRKPSSRPLFVSELAAAHAFVPCSKASSSSCSRGGRPPTARFGSVSWLAQPVDQGTPSNIGRPSKARLCRHS